jgi:hypothetical protein
LTIDTYLPAGEVIGVDAHRCRAIEAHDAPCT